MDIMTVFETVVGGSSPSGGIKGKNKKTKDSLWTVDNS